MSGAQIRRSASLSLPGRKSNLGSFYWELSLITVGKTQYADGKDRYPAASWWSYKGDWA